MLIFPPDDVREPLYTAIGTIAVHWALLEFSLDAVTTMIFYQGGNAIEKSMPFSLSKKTDFIKRCLTKMDSLSDFPEGRQLMIDIDREANFRHDVIHGYMAGMDEETGAFHFVKVRLKKMFTTWTPNSTPSLNY